MDTLIYFITLVVSVLLVCGNTIIFYRFLRKCKDSKHNLKEIVYDSDWYPSLSSAQFFLWTFVIATLFLWVCLIKLSAYIFDKGTIEFTLEIPENIFLLMGLSGITAVASKGASIYKYGIDKKATERPKELQELPTMLLENGKASLTRYQMFFWTVISVFVYIIYFFLDLYKHLNDINNLTLPDIPLVLVVLMGISQATYIGGKLASVPTDNKIPANPPEEGTQSEK